MNNLLAQTKAVQINVPGRDAGDSAALLAWSSAIGGMIGACLMALLIVRWRARRYDPAEAAFRKLARAAGMTRRQRRVLREVARAAGIEKPVGLLMSAAALKRVTEQAAAGPALCWTDVNRVNDAAAAKTA